MQFFEKCLFTSYIERIRHQLVDGDETVADGTCIPANMDVYPANEKSLTVLRCLEKQML